VEGVALHGTPHPALMRLFLEARSGLVLAMFI
jgi:hypothetical protein